MWIIMYTFCAGIYRFFAPFFLTLSFSISLYFSVGSLPPQCKQHEVRKHTPRACPCSIGVSASCCCGVQCVERERLGMSLCQDGGFPWRVKGCTSKDGRVMATFPPCQFWRKNEAARYGDRRTALKEL